MLPEFRYFSKYFRVKIGNIAKLLFNTNKSIQNIITKKQLLTYPSFVHQIEFLLLLMLSKVEDELAKSIDKKYIFEELQHKL